MNNKQNNSYSGYLYCIYNKMYDVYGENIYKLGNMKNKNRMNSYVTPYIDSIEIKLISNKINDKTIGEKILFDILNKYRVKPNREFFNCDLSIIKNAMNEVETIMVNESIEDLKKIYNPVSKEQIIDIMISINNKLDENTDGDNEITDEDVTNDENTIDDENIVNFEINNKYKNINEQLQNKLRIELTPDIITKWYNKEYILDNALYALGKKHYDDSLDPYLSNIGMKIKYLNYILDIFGFKSLLDFDTVVESSDTLNNKMENSKLMDKVYYSKMMKVFNKQEQAKDMDGKFKKDKFTKKCNCILNEFGFKIDSNRQSAKEKGKTIWNYQYYISEHMMNIISILYKY